METYNENFAEELTWCITQLELGLMRQSPDSKQVAETMKVLKVLKSSKAPLVKKRQAMRNALGDYRKKMKAAEAKTLSSLRHSKFKAVDRSKMQKKSMFLKQSYSKQQHPVDIQLSVNLTDLNLGQSTKERSGGDNLACCVADQPSQPSCSKDGPQYKYVPSDNTFCFNFSCDPIEDVKKETETVTSSGFQAEPSTINRTANVMTIFEESTRDFKFQFESTECGS